MQDAGQIRENTMDFARAKALLPLRPADGHKGTFGRVAVIGGSVGLTGAPVLAARAAARTGSGLVYTCVPEGVYPIVAASCLEVMPSPLPDERGRISAGAFFQILERLNACNAGLIGPGLSRSPELSLLVCKLLEQTKTPLVLDADGLYAVKDRKEILRQRGEKGLVTVLTPHEGEFAYLGGGLKAVPDDVRTADGAAAYAQRRLAAARAFARDYSCILVLKGPGTVTAAPDGTAFVNTTGNSGMAKGGSGDVLGGMILSLLGQLAAQGKLRAVPGTGNVQLEAAGLTPAEAAALGVYLHGLAGDLCREDLGEYGMLPSDMTLRIPAAILRLQQG